MPLDDALLSLQGLSVGDAFGECFFNHPAEMIASPTIPPDRWDWTDATHVALSAGQVPLDWVERREPLPIGFN